MVGRQPKHAEPLHNRESRRAEMGERWAAEVGRVPVVLQQCAHLCRIQVDGAWVGVGEAHPSQHRRSSGLRSGDTEAVNGVECASVQGLVLVPVKLASSLSRLLTFCLLRSLAQLLCSTLLSTLDFEARLFSTLLVGLATPLWCLVTPRLHLGTLGSPFCCLLLLPSLCLCELGGRCGSPRLLPLPLSPHFFETTGRARSGSVLAGERRIPPFLCQSAPGIASVTLRPEHGFLFVLLRCIVMFVGGVNI
mmetsp:Transcript_68296/g.160596  ORF Transcript_68296/g.160596 Transcript_68296/m.160596 type:complete len:249 (-) Transcript_68296:264-1010(-)